ncbi:protein spire homolog 1-like isoform X2 [Empidonax traillii]|uniref:protein spire homolog 1-like isoform X2 n=1 Tax=Empidonax traillii TaxID=164674 RepID=UPI000FFD02F8|nr:protein spire homolog 1-like isoform X2 [Empidonax traillii]
MESLRCEQRITKVSLAELLRCFEHPISEEQAWAICFQCCCKMKQLAGELCPPLHSVFIKGCGSILIHADGTASFKVYHKSDVGSIQQSEDKLLEYLGVVIYEALDWGIDSQLERELSGPLEKLLCLMLKLDDEPIKPEVTLQDVIKRLRKMDVEDLVENPLQKKKNCGAPLWPSVISELQAGVRLHKASERPQRCVPPKERARSPFELLLDDIQHKRYTLRKVMVEQKHKDHKVDVAAPKPHLKLVLERQLKECVPCETSWHEQPMAEIKQPQKLQSAAAQEKGSRPKEMLLTPSTALNSPSDGFLTLQDASTEFKVVNTKTQQLGPGVQETTPELPDSACLSPSRSSLVSYNSTGLTADSLCPPCPPTPGDVKPKSFLNTVQQQLPPYGRRSKSLETGLQSKELDCLFPTKWVSPTIAELIGTRYSEMVLEGQDFLQRNSNGVFLRAKICFSCHKQMFLKWPYNCYLCSSVVCCDCCIKMSMPFRTCVHLPLHFLKFLRLSREDDPATEEQKSSELLHEIEHRQYFGVPIILEPRCLARPLCCYTRAMADWLTADICTHCEQYLMNVASQQQQSIPPRRTSWA